MNGAQWLAKTLRERGVERVFCLCGNGLDPFLDACLDHDLAVLDVRNEQAASYMADTWGRMTGTLGVAAVSSGPGHTNALTGLANAFWDGGPMLLISGSSPERTRGMDHFQDLNQVAMAAPVCKYATVVTHASKLPHEVSTALSAATTGRPVPAHLTIPVDVLRGEVDRTLYRRQDPPQAAVDSREILPFNRPALHPLASCLNRISHLFQPAFFSQ